MADPKDFPVVPNEDEPKSVANVDPDPNANPNDGGDPDADPTNPDGENQGDKPKRKGGWQRKIERQEREIEFWRNQALTRPNPAQSQTAPAAETKADETPEPDPNDFETTGDYLAAVRKYDREQVKKELRAELVERDKVAEQRTQQKTLEQRWQERTAKAVAEIPDYKELAQDAIYALNRHSNPSIDGVVAAIQDSDLGPQIVAHLGEHPEDVERLAALSPLGAIRELGKIEAKLAEQTAPAKAKEADEDPNNPAAQPKPATQAPPPPTPIKKPGPAVAFDVNNDKTDIDTWMKKRWEQVAKQRK